MVNEAVPVPTVPTVPEILKTLQGIQPVQLWLTERGVVTSLVQVSPSVPLYVIVNPLIGSVPKFLILILIGVGLHGRQQLY